MKIELTIEYQTELKSLISSLNFYQNLDITAYVVDTWDTSQYAPGFAWWCFIHWYMQEFCGFSFRSSNKKSRTSS
jgi:hypothetical protein